MSSVVVNNVEYKIGRASAAQVSGIAKILSKVTREVSSSIGNLEEADTFAILSGVLGSVSEENLVRLGALCIGVDEEYAQEHFDLVWVSDALATLMEETDIVAVTRNFTRIFSRFQA